MNSDDYHDRLVDLLLCELVGNESPPDVRGRVLAAVDRQPRKVGTGLRRPQPAKPSKLPALAAVAFVVLIGAVGVFIYLQQISAGRTPMVTAVSGAVDHSKTGLTTGAESTATITYRDGTVVELSPDTIIRMPGRSLWDRSKKVEIVAGELFAEVAPQPVGHPMVLISRDARAEVVGTRLSMKIENDRTRLEVTEGAVRFVPKSGGTAVMVKPGLFAEAGSTGVRSGAVKLSSTRGIASFTLMNAVSDQPIRVEPLVDGEVISLAALPTREINIRAEYEGAAPTSVKIAVTRDDGASTGLPAHVARPQKHPPFFVAGDHWSEGRPNDCRAWMPLPGRYRISAIAVNEDGTRGKPLEMNFSITD